MAEVHLDLSRPFWQMTGGEQAEFLERLAQRLERTGDDTAALTARIWSGIILDRHQLPPLAPGTRAELSGEQAEKRLYEAARWCQNPENYLYVSGRVLHAICLGLHTKLTLERAHGREVLSR
ncbi:MAG: hypothetical protein ACOY94_06125 [Bacillota bacterium]